MVNYKKIDVSIVNDNIIEKIYESLLTEKCNFVILNINGVLKVLTKEKSIFEISDEQKFLDEFEQDIYYKTIVDYRRIEVNENDLKIYKNYIKKFRDKMQKNIYADKYIFGSIAVKTENGFITTIRGKENLDDYTIVYKVDHVNHILYVIDKKATLNAPLLDLIFKNKKVKAIAHFHEYDNKLPYYDYAFPGSIKDSIRNNETSFNIKHHGVIYLFDKKGNII